MAAVAPSPAEVFAWAWTVGAKAKLHRQKLERSSFMISLVLMMLRCSAVAMVKSRDNLPAPELAQKDSPREDSDLLMNSFHPFIANH